MKKLINLSFIYGILAMISGVFYREFTKFNDFVGKTSLSFTHTHLFVLGMIFFLVVLLVDKEFKLREHKNFNKFLIVYNLGLIITVITFVWRGVTEVLKMQLSSALTASISGIAGIGHLFIGIGVIMFFLILKKSVEKVEA